MNKFWPYYQGVSDQNKLVEGDGSCKAPVTLSRFKPRFTTTHPDLRQMVKSGCIGMRRDGKKEIPVSIRCLTVLLRCQHDSSTDLLRLMTAALRFTTVELRMLTNAHDASTIRYGASTIQAGSATVASRPPTNLHDLVVAMRQSRGGGGGGTLIFSSYFGSGPASTVHPPPPPPPKKKRKKGISRTPKNI